MQKDQLKKCVGHIVRLIPIAHRLDPRGFALPPIDDEWLIESVTDEGVRISLARTGHFRMLGFDHVHGYMSDRVLNGVKHAFLTLNVQLSIQGNDVHVFPTRPGVSVPPRIPPNPIRLALLQRLWGSPGQNVAAHQLTEFPCQAVIDEIVRCEAEGLLEAKILRDGGCNADAVALQILRPGIEWLQQQRFT